MMNVPQTLRPTRQKKIISAIQLTQHKLGKFFGTKIESPKVFLLSGRKQIDEIWGRKTEEWFCAWASDGHIYILDPAIYTRESNHSLDHFWQTIEHELAHLYFKKLTGTNKPKWLNEGLACYLAGQVKKPLPINELLKVASYFSKSDRCVYQVGYFWVSCLIKRFGIKKFKAMLKSLTPEINPRSFSKLFFKVYGERFNQAGLKNILADK